MKTCYQCIHLKERIGKNGLTEPYCAIGVTNKRDDRNRKDGKCIKYAERKD